MAINTSTISKEFYYLTSGMMDVSIKKIPDVEIIDEIYRQINKTITRTGLFYVRKQIKNESYHWYQTLREGQ